LITVVPKTKFHGKSMNLITRLKEMQESSRIHLLTLPPYLLIKVSRVFVCSLSIIHRKPNYIRKKLIHFQVDIFEGTVKKSIRVEAPLEANFSFLRRCDVQLESLKVKSFDLPKPAVDDHMLQLLKRSIDDDDV